MAVLAMLANVQPIQVIAVNAAGGVSMLQQVGIESTLCPELQMCT